MQQMHVAKDRRDRMQWIREAVARRDEFFWLRVVGGSTAIALAVVVAVVNGIDDAFLIVVGVAAFVLAFPWQRLSSLRAGPFAFSLEHGQVRGAVDSFEIESTEKQQLKALLSRLATDIDRARGGRVLWVDDLPLRVVGERRLFRALGIETVSVTSSRDAAQMLKRDNDFDLVITSLERASESGAMRSENGRYPGVVFVQWLRGAMDDAIQFLTGEEDAIKDPVINKLAVIFYTAFQSLSDIKERTRAAAELDPGVEVSRTLDDLLKKALRGLADARSNPIEVPLSKKVSS